MELRLVPARLPGTFRTKSKWRHQTVHLERVAQENQLELRSLCHTISGLRRPCSRLVKMKRDGAETCSATPSWHLPHEKQVAPPDSSPRTSGAGKSAGTAIIVSHNRWPSPPLLAFGQDEQRWS